jgi:1A family penicillin-binding protein
MPKPKTELTGQDSKKITKKQVKTWAMTAGVIILMVGLAGILSFTILMAWVSRDLPDPNTLLTRDIPQSTKIFDRTGKVLLYEIHGDEKRTLVTIDQIPESMKQATIAIEDKTFYEHHGINWLRIVKAVYVDVIQHRKAQGASTLTQQLVKNAILTNEKSWERKLKEFLLALQMERHYSKDQILQMYLNEVPYGSTIYGIESASQSYFGKGVKDLTLDESALLASIPQSPDYYSPYGTGIHGDNRTDLVARQHLVLDSMAQQKYITQQQADEAKQIDTLKKLLPRTIGNIKAPHFVMYVKSQLEETYGQKKVEQGGLIVTTTLDWNKEQAAEEEVVKGVDKNGPKFGFANASLVSLDPKTGQILAMVGSKDFFDEAIDGQVNVALRPRQPGSSFKPIVYAAGFIKGYTPETILWDVLTTFKTDIGNYIPKNYSPKYNGPVTVRKALQGSLNIPAVEMLYLVGIDRVLDFAEQLGYTTLADRSRFGLSLVLGGGEVKLIEHTNAFSAFANNGMQYPVSSILKVTEPDGTALEEWKQPDGSQVMPKETAEQISNVLSDNASRAYIFGAKNYLTLSDRAVATKTGTTNNYKDAWTMGYTPNLVTGVWTGNSKGKEMKFGADGSVIAAPIWQAYMKRALADMPKESFIAPPPLDYSLKSVLIGKSLSHPVKVDKISGLLATEYTPPENVIEKQVFEGHNILYYVNKDDPRGPYPANPQNDPQYNNWENAVQEWIQKNQWHTTDTIPTLPDTVHTKENQPVVTLYSPQQNQTITQRDLTINANVQAPRSIARIEIDMDGVAIGYTSGNTAPINVKIPNVMANGYHDIVVTAIDDVGNRGSSKATINLMADQNILSLEVKSPASNTTLFKSQFPQSIVIQTNDVQGVSDIQVVYEQNGVTQTIGTIQNPSSFISKVVWTNAPNTGSANIYAIAHKNDNSSVQSGTVQVNIND